MSNYLHSFWRDLRRQPVRRLPDLAVLFLVALGVFLASCHYWAWHHFRIAEQAIQHGDYHQAEKHLTPCLKVWSGKGQPHFLMAQACRWLGKHDEASEQLDHCERLNWSPEDVDRERLLLMAQKGQFLDLENTLLSWAFGDEPAAAAAQEVLTQQYSRNCRVRQAQYWAERFLQSHPDHLAILKTMAFLHYRNRNPIDCLKCYRRALAIQPEDDEARQALAEALVQCKQEREALGEYQQLGERHPDSVSIWVGQARCYRCLGKLADARQILERLVAEHPNNEAVLGQLGRLAYTEQRVSEAEKWMTKALARCPSNWIYLYTMYLCLKKQGKDREARYYHTRYKKVLRDRDRLEYLTGEGLSTQPHNPDIPCEIGLICLRNEINPVGVFWLQKAVQLRPWHWRANQALAEYYERVGNKKLAAQHRTPMQGSIWQSGAGDFLGGF